MLRSWVNIKVIQTRIKLYSLTVFSIIPSLKQISSQVSWHMKMLNVYFIKSSLNNKQFYIQIHSRYETIWLNSLHVMTNVKVLATQDSQPAKHDSLHRSIWCSYASKSPHAPKPKPSVPGTVRKYQEIVDAPSELLTDPVWGPGSEAHIQMFLSVQGIARKEQLLENSETSPLPWLQIDFLTISGLMLALTGGWDSSVCRVLGSLSCMMQSCEFDPPLSLW